MASLASAARTQVAAEASGRGEVAGSEVHGWLRQRAPSLRQGGAASVARLAVDLAAAGSGPAAPVPDERSPLGLVWEAVRTGRIEAATGCAVLREATRLAPLLQDAAVPTVTSALVDLAADWGPSMMRRLRPRLLAEHGRAGVFDDLHERLGSAARLSMPHVESGDLTEYQLWMTPEQAATLEAAIGPLSPPAPNPETREADLRPAGQRFGEALTEVCRRASAGPADGPEAVAGSSAVLHVTIPLADLVATRGAGEAIGTVADGTPLTALAVRRLGCDATLVPQLLGLRGEPLVLGRAARLFTRGQRRHLWLRDRGCTFPGCTAPASWCEAHHVRHWAEGGATDASNAALLCPRHHTTVHRRRLFAEVRQHPDDRGRHVVWDLTTGSYDRIVGPAPPGRAPAVPAALLTADPGGEDDDALPWFDPPLPDVPECTAA
ncbi:DUF222 domain-containing protein [Phycicoccus sp.]|uniref:HNH endonuclease signature motif containing protein n=1 Tax=Phycicoccus sp. TaxID=1902410 RepID=UPI002C56DABA|nr:DUF222 domain-containing protein [Phycicoccus sp.]HMM93535.1 DUF222 domain-containing protein [Phycicoccus sp.]